MSSLGFLHIPYNNQGAKKTILFHAIEQFGHERDTDNHQKLINIIQCLIEKGAEDSINSNLEKPADTKSGTKLVNFLLGAFSDSMLINILILKRFIILI